MRKRLTMPSPSNGFGRSPRCSEQVIQMVRGCGLHKSSPSLRSSCMKPVPSRYASAQNGYSAPASSFGGTCVVRPREPEKRCDPRPVEQGLGQGAVPAVGLDELDDQSIGAQHLGV